MTDLSPDLYLFEVDQNFDAFKKGKLIGPVVSCSTSIAVNMVPEGAYRILLWSFEIFDCSDISSCIKNCFVCNKIFKHCGSIDFLKIAFILEITQNFFNNTWEKIFIALY